MLTGENHLWIGFVARFVLAILIIVVFALPLLHYITQP